MMNRKVFFTLVCCLFLSGCACSINSESKITNIINESVDTTTLNSSDAKIPPTETQASQIIVTAQQDNPDVINHDDFQMPEWTAIIDSDSSVDFDIVKKYFLGTWSCDSEKLFIDYSNNRVLQYNNYYIQATKQSDEYVVMKIVRGGAPELFCIFHNDLEKMYNIITRII